MNVIGLSEDAMIVYRDGVPPFPYMLHWWGARADEAAADLGWTPYLWFADAFDRAAAREILHSRYGLVSRQADGDDTHFRKIVQLRLKFQGVEYAAQHDMGYGYDDDLIEWIIESKGDDSLADMIREKHPEVPELSGDDEIEVVEFCIVAYPETA